MNSTRETVCYSFKKINVWEIPDWKFCNNCNLFHSNRTIPQKYWDEWEHYTNKEVKKKCGIFIIKNDKFFAVQSYWKRP